MVDKVDLDSLSQQERAEIYFSAARLSKGKKSSPANQLTDRVIRWLESIGGAGRRVNTQGQYDSSKGIWRKSGMKKGFEDVDAIYPLVLNGVKIGIKLAIEIKIGKDRLSDDQKERMAEVEKCGGFYIVAKDIEQTIADVELKIKKLVSELTK